MGSASPFTGTGPRAVTQLQAPGTVHLFGIDAHGGLHGQGGVAGAQGMVFVGNGGAKRAMMPSPST